MGFGSLKRRFLFTNYPDVGLLLMRIGFGGSMLLGHGVDKVIHFNDVASRFPNPIGIGSWLGAFLMTFSEFAFSIAVICGFFTRIASFGLAFGMGVAFFIVHASQHFSEGELAFLYFMGFLSIFFAGPGRYSIDRRL